jgi:hypothetical protein
MEKLQWMNLRTGFLFSRDQEICRSIVRVRRNVCKHAWTGGMFVRACFAQASELMDVNGSATLICALRIANVLISGGKRMHALAFPLKVLIVACKQATTGFLAGWAVATQGVISLHFFDTRCRSRGKFAHLKRKMADIQYFHHAVPVSVYYYNQLRIHHSLISEAGCRIQTKWR